MPHATLADGVRLSYRLDGPEDGPVVLLSNSLGADLSLWEAQVPALAERYRVVRYDARGHGGSDVPEGDYTMDGLGADALALLDHLGVKTARVAGVSMGGAVVQWLAANAPDRIERLVIANSGAVFATPQVWQERADLVRAKGTAVVVEPTVQRWFTPGFIEREPATVERVRAMIGATPAVGYVGSCAALRDTDYRPAMAAIRAPTLVIAGAHDAATPPERSHELAAGIAGAQLVTFDAAHMSPLEMPEAFTALLLEFFA